MRTASRDTYARLRMAAWIVRRHDSGHVFQDIRVAMHRHRSGEIRCNETSARVAAAVALSLVPMSFAAAGAWFDERTHLGFSNWRSACRAAGLTFTSLLSLHARAAAVRHRSGALVGVASCCSSPRRRRGIAPGLALRSRAHAGCALGMTVGIAAVRTDSASLPVDAGRRSAACRVSTALAVVPSARGGERAARIRRATYLQALACVVGRISTADAPAEDFAVIRPAWTAA